METESKEYVYKTLNRPVPLEVKEYNRAQLNCTSRLEL